MKNVLQIIEIFLEKNVCLGTVHWQVLCRNKNGGSIASLQTPLFGNFIFKSSRLVLILFEVKQTVIGRYRACVSENVSMWKCIASVNFKYLGSPRPQKVEMLFIISVVNGKWFQYQHAAHMYALIRYFYAKWFSFNQLITLVSLCQLSHKIY